MKKIAIKRIKPKVEKAVTQNQKRSRMTIDVDDLIYFGE